ncbi:MAG: hypothetical protein WCO42_06235 [bacterium]
MILILSPIREHDSPCDLSMTACLIRPLSVLGLPNRVPFTRRVLFIPAFVLSLILTFS